MKQCKVYSSEKKNETAGIIVEGHVLLPAARHDDIEPAYTVDKQCYYPPFYAVDFAKNLHYDLMPFSTECEWGEYADIDSLIHNYMCYYSGDDYEEKWGYCDTKTGRICIPPEMGYCEDFNKYGAAIFGDMEFEWPDTRGSVRDGVYSGIISTTGNIIDCGYVGIQKSYHDVFFVYQTADGWGAVDSEGHRLLEPLWQDISWDGMGGFTVIRHERENGRRTYGIINAEAVGCVTEGLTEEPATIYYFPPEKRRENLPWDEHYHAERFRLTKKDNKYGLIRDVLENQREPLRSYSELILKPEFDYDELPDAAYNAWVEAEIFYYAKVLEKTPRVFPSRIGDGWDAVPEDIREDVRGYMANNGMEQPETVEDVQRKWR